MVTKTAVKAKTSSKTARVAPKRSAAKVARSTRSRKTTATAATAARSDRSGTRSAKRAAPASLDEALSGIEALERIKTDLENTRSKLLDVDETDLDAAQREAWQHQLGRVDLAVAQARQLLLGAIIDAFAAELPSLQSATSALAKQLERLERAAAIIDAVAGVLGVIEKVITLGR